MLQKRSKFVSVEKEIENDRDEGDEEHERKHFGDDPERFKRKPDRERENT